MASAVFRLSKFVLLNGSRLMHNQLQATWRANYSSSSIEIANVVSKVTEFSENANGSEMTGTVSVENLLSNVHQLNISPTDAVTMLNILRKQSYNQEFSSKSYKDDERFKMLCDLFGKKCNLVGHSALVFGLRSLLEIGVNPEAECVKSVENEVLWRSRKLNMKNLVLCLWFHSHHENTDLQKTVVNSLLDVIQRRWFEITEGSDALKLLQMVHRFNEAFVVKLEDKLMELSEEMSVAELCKLMCVLAEKNRRSTPLLRAISFHLNQRPEKLNVKQIISILFALNTLSFPDSTLLLHLTNDLISEIPSINKPSSISAILTCCGLLKWRHSTLLETCKEWILKNLDKCRPQEFVAYVLTLAAVNYIPEEAEHVFSTILPHLTREKIVSNSIWLDVTWSLAVLGYAEKDQLLRVVTPYFYHSLLASEECNIVNAKLKLLNLKALLTKKHPDSKLPSDSSLMNVQVPVGKESESCKKQVVSALSNIVSQGKYMQSNRNTNMGFCIDAEFIIDINGKPLLLSQYDVGGKPKVSKPLPIGANRIALLVWNYKDFTLNEISLTGTNALAIRLLTSQDYVVVQVPYSEFKENETVAKQVEYLQQKINEARNEKNRLKNLIV